MNHDQSLHTLFVNHCSKGDLNLVELYVKRAGVDVNARDTTTDLTALMAACEGGHIKVVLYLLQKGFLSRIPLAPRHPELKLHSL